MKQLDIVLDVECEGCIYTFEDGFMVLVYGFEGDELYFTKDLKQAKEFLSVYDDEEEEEEEEED